MDFNAEIETKALEQALKMISDDALPEAMSHTLNFITQRVEDKARANVRSSMIVRTPYTTNGIRQDRRARGKNVDRMFARTSVLTPYLQIQDEGGQIQANSIRVNIPTLATRRGSIQNRIGKRYYANTDNPNRFIGVPKGGNRPLGVYERYGNNKRLRMLRNLTKNTVRIRPTRFFSDAVKDEATPEKITMEFNRNARRIIARVQRRA